MPRSAKRSLLSRHAPQASLQQQPEGVVPPAADAVTHQLPEQRLDAIQEGTEEPLAQPVPRIVQQTNDAAQPVATAGQHGQGQGLAAPEGAVPAPPEAEQAAARQQHASATGSHRASPLSAPKPLASSSNSGRLEPVAGRSGHQHAGLSHPVTPPAAVPEDASEAGTALSLLQLAQAPSTQQQRQQQASSTSASEQPVAKVWSNQMPAGQQGEQVGGGVGAHERQGAVGGGDDLLQGLRASLVQILTSTLESAMTQMR